MAGQPGTLETLARQAGLALQPLEQQLTPANLIPFLAQLGLQFPPQLLSQASFMNAVNSGSTAAGKLPALLTQLATDITNGDDAAILADGLALVQQIQTIVSSLQTIGNELGNIAGNLPGLTPADVAKFAQNLAENLLSYLLISYLETAQPGLVAAANLAGILDYLPNPGVSGDPTHPPYISRQLRLSNVGQLFTDPATLFKTITGWGDPTFDGTQLLPRLGAALSLLGLPSTSTAPGKLDSFIFSIQANPAISPPGLLATTKYALPANLNLTVPLGSTWSVQTQVQGAFVASLQATLTPPAGASVTPPTGTLAGQLQLNLVAQAPDATHPLILVGQTGGSYLGAKSVTLGAGVTVAWDSTSGTATAAPEVQFQVTQGTVYIDMSDADGFLSEVLGGTPVQAAFALSAIWRPDTGLHIQGGAQLELDLPLHLELGPVTLPMLYLISGVDSAGIPLEISAALGVTLGPIQAAVDRVGITTNLSFPSGGGNLGPAQLAPIAFKPPNGLGIDLDLGLAAGGGYITFDPNKGQYTGVLQVSLVDVLQVTVIGVLDTKMPDGSTGYSFLLFITFNFPPIELGFGFTLNGVGGVGGVNHTMAVDALQAGFRAHTLAMVLSPPDPIANAPQIISDMENFFPTAAGRYLFGPLLTIGWGTPTLVTFTLGVLLEVPDPIRLVILGLIVAGLPSEDEALLVLHIEVLGEVDFGAQTLSIDGSLYDSSLLMYALAGNLALRLAWGSNSNFLFSLGGFNPHFNTDGLNIPANMQRMSVSIGDGDNPRISSNSYFAITSNSVQFGANVQAYASAGGFSIQGYLGFDLLVILSPFSFEFDFSASFDVRYDGTTLAGLGVNGTLSGPTPWHLHADASITLLFFTVSESVDLTWGNSTQATIPQQPILPDLYKALQNPASWSAALPAGTGPTVTLTTPAPGSQTLLVHPMGTLTVKETVVPLDLQISRYGNATPSDGTEFSISSVASDSASETIQSIQDYFAPGQFLDLSDADKLSDPSFELYDAGVTIGSTSAVLTGQDSARVVSYDEIYIDDLNDLSRFSRIYQMPEAIHMALSNQGAGFASPAKNTGLAKYRVAEAGTPISVTSVQYVVTSVTDLSLRPDIVSANGSTYYQARAALATYLDSHPAESEDLQIMPLHEVGA